MNLLFFRNRRYCRWNKSDVIFFLLLTLFILLLLMAGSVSAATTFTDFYVQTTGNNLNAGSTTDNTAPHTYTGGTFVRATGVFTPASENPVTDGVTVGQWASIYTTAGATVATCIGLITNVSTTTITISQAAIGGAVANVSESAAAATCKVGGAWAGPNTNANPSVSFPFGFAVGTMSNAPNVAPRINWKAGLYSVTNAITHSLNGPIRFEGYTSSPGDGGQATLDGTWAGTLFTLLTLSGVDYDVVNFIFQNNGASGSGSHLVSLSGSEAVVKNCVFQHSRAFGLTIGSGPALVIDCVATDCGNDNTPATGGFRLIGTAALNCISYSNTAAKAVGFMGGTGYSVFMNCIAYGNGTNGFEATSAAQSILVNCDSYENKGHGIDLTAVSAASVEIINCNLLHNGGWGITSSGSSLRSGTILNCGFGAGTQANASGTIAANTGGINVVGTVTYANDTTPWVNAAGRDFTLTAGSAAAFKGYGTFPFNTLSYPSIGASYPTNSGGSGGTVGYGFAQ